MSACFLPDLEKGVNLLGQSYSSYQLECFATFLKLMQEWNRVMNLTTITAPRQMVSRHILDSLSIEPFLEGSPILDVGTGAGLPGIPLSIAHPDKQFILLDKSVKRLQFLLHVKQVLGLKNIELTCERVESLTNISFPCIVSRAFARIDKLIDASGHLLSDEGRILAMTGVVSKDILGAIPVGWIIKEYKLLNIPWLERDHYLVWLQKITS